MDNIRSIPRDRVKSDAGPSHIRHRPASVGRPTLTSIFRYGAAEPGRRGPRPMTVTLVSRLRAVAVAALLPVVVAGVGLSSCAAGGPGNAPSVQSPASASTSPSVQSPDGAEASNSPAPTGSPSGQATCRASSPATRMTLTEADNGATVCLARAGTVELYLHGTAADRGSPFAVTGSALRRLPS